MGKKTKVTISKDLIKDLKKYSEKFCVGMATQVRDDLTEQTVFAIGKFYMDYKPKYYKRHYYNFMDNSYKKYYSNPHGHIIRGGVELSYMFMDDIYQDDTEEVFDFVYHGFHGVASAFDKQNNPIAGKRTIPSVMKPSPLDIIYNRRKYIISNINEFTNKAYEKAKSYNYDTLN